MVRTPGQKKAYRQRKERRAGGEYKESAETRARKSEAQSSEKNGMWGTHLTDEAKAILREANLGKPSAFRWETHTDATKAKLSEANLGKIHTDATKAKICIANLGKHPSDVTKAKISEANRGKTRTDATRKKSGDAIRKTWLDKQWYGVVTYRDPKLYCVIFNFEFKERCRAYWEYESVLEPHKTQAENCIIHGKHARLTVHHVYYQPKACCGYDEDIQGYYAMINLGTERKPNMVRHNIKGDPNKFVILTHSENILANSDKLVWIKKFEDMIEEQGGKCYLTKEEMVEYKKLGNS